MFSDKRVIVALFLFSILGIFFVFSYAWSQSDSVDSIVKISVCGNFVAEGGEECDNYDFAGQSCSSFGFSSGSLICYSDCTINTSACYNQSTPPPGGGGGGGLLPPPVTGVNISGRAYPLSQVVVLKDGQIAATTIAGPNANFAISVGGLAPGNYTFAVYGQDNKNLRSSLFTFPVYISSGVIVNISGVFIAPTIALDKIQVKIGDDIAIFGQSAPHSVVTLSINSPVEIFHN
ncbi:MAG: hypothetical protein PHO91_04270, partial [Patescibacteria group bacterium]|nr:hypothetical protein [Patescibacteria group bacterium]